MSNVRIGAFHPVQAAPEDIPARVGARASDSLLPAPTSSLMAGDAIDEIAMLLVKANTADKQASRMTQRTEEIAQSREDAAQVQSMHHEADEIRSEGWAEGIVSITGAVLDGYARFTTPETGKGSTTHILAAAMAKSSDGVSSMFGKQYAANAKLAAADGKAHEAASNVAQRAAKQAHEDEMDAREAVRKALEFVKEMKNAQSSALSAAASYRA